jgi:hypothetical protein
LESSVDKSDTSMEESEGAGDNSTQKMYNEASKFLNENTKVEENFITRMLERCWEPLPSLKIPRR